MGSRGGDANGTLSGEESGKEVIEDYSEILNLKL